MKNHIRTLAAFGLGTLMALTAGAQPVNTVNDFSTQPLAADWATTSVSGSANDNYSMDSDVNSSITAAAVTARTVSDAGNPPGANASATWSSAGMYLQLRPTGNRYSVLMGKFVNNTLTNATQITISYALTLIGGGVAEESGRGTRVYYSLTGAAGSWVNLPTLNSTANSGTFTLSTNLPLNWTNGATLYLLWADDNATGNPTDSAYQIDNFLLAISEGMPLSFSCAVTSPTNNALFPAGTPITASASIGSGTPPYTVQYFTNSGAGNTVFAPAGSSGTAPYAVSLGSLPAGTYNIYAVASDAAADPETATSLTNTFVVADPLICTLATPANNATFDHTTAVNATATVTGGAPPYSVQFYLDDATNGAPVTTAPYERNFGPLFVGDHTVKAVARDVNGWGSTSAVATVLITGPLAVTLTPTNGATYNFGRELILSADPGGGSPPYAVTFYTNGQAVGTLTAAPFTTNLGLLPVGSYTSYVHAVDSSPTTQQADSTTNVITIAPNPLVATLTAPTAGQQVGTNVVFSVTATASVLTPLTVRNVEFFYDGESLGVDSTAPYSMVVSNRVLGSHTVYAVATDSLGRTATTATNQMTFIVDPLANNNFANRIPLTLPAKVTGANVGATTESGEPTGSGFTRWGATLWWTWTAPTNGPVQVDTLGSDFNTMLGVYTGSAVNALTVVASNDNAPGVSSGPSLVTFNAVAGTTYQIVVGGIQGFGGGSTPATGNIVLSLTMPPTVSLTTPTNNAVFQTGSNILLSATASAALGTLEKVEFFRAGTNIATLTQAPYTFEFAGAPSGSNTFFAVATDSLGQATTSAVVRVLVADLGVTLTTPADGATYTTTGSIAVSAYPLLVSGTMTSVTFLADDAVIGTDTTSPFGITWTNVTSGVHKLAAVGTDDSGLQYTSAPVLIAVARTLLPTGAEWNYYDKGEDLGTAWLAPEFDDSSWDSGPAELGYGDGDEATEVASGPANNYFITTYFRRAVVVTNVGAYAEFILSVKRDDGAVVYVNGREAARFNMNPGVVTYSTLAPNASDDGTNFYTASVAATNFVEGTNVLAVEVHQSSATSSDMSFNLALLGVPIIPRNALPVAALLSPASGSSYVTPPSIALTAEASDKDGTVTNVEFFADGVKIGEAASAPYSVVWANPSPGIYHVTAVATDDQGGQGVSAPITLSVFGLATTWTAYNDQIQGPNTHVNATIYNPFGKLGGGPVGGPLHDVGTGEHLAAYLMVTKMGVQAGTVCGAPPVGTPAYALFNGYVDFGTGDGNHAILIGRDGYLSHRFTGLNPQRTYRLRATVTGGVPANSNSWTRMRLDAASCAPAHTANVVTSAQQPQALATNEAVLNGGDNRTGDVVGWDYIVPNEDGTMELISTLYTGPAPGNQHPAAVAYGIVALRLEEIGPTPLVELTAPRDGFVVMGPTNVALSAEASGYGGVAQVVFLGNGAPVATATTSPYNGVWADVPFGSNSVAAVVYDTLGRRATSAPVAITITVPPSNGVAPTILSKNPDAYATVSNLTSIRVIFSENVVNVDAGDLLINDVPATNVTRTGYTNYLFTFPQPPYGPISVTWATNHGITDVGWPANLPFDQNDPGAVWEYVLVDKTPPTVAAKVPAAGATLSNLTQITVTFSELVTGVDASDLLIAGTPAYDLAVSGSNYVFTFSQPASGTINITWATNHGITDLADQPNAFNRTGSGATWSYTLDAKTTLIQSNSFWLFIKGTNEASVPTNAWRQLAFDDSGWSNAPAPFFYGDPYSNGVPAFTLLDDMRSNYTSIYLRKPFVVPNAANITNLYLRAIMDDGMVVWINGVEVLRYNVPAGELGYGGTASSAAMEQNGLNYTNFTLLNPTNYLVSGTNVIAVHAFNESLSTSSDFGFNAQLYTYLPNTELAAPLVAAQEPAPGYLMALTNIVVIFSEPVTNLHAEDLLVNGVPATSVVAVSNRFFTFGFPQPPYGPVAITWAANHGIVDLDLTPKPFVASYAGNTWQYVLLNPNSPYLVSVEPVQSATVTQLTQIAITFSEPVTGVEAADLLINGVPAAAMTGSGTNYVFTFPQPAYGTVAITWATNHGIADLALPPEAFDPLWPNHTWTYALVDQIPPVIAAVNPPAGSFVNNLTQLTVTFSESVSGVNASDLLLNGKAATSVTGSGATYTFTFAQPNASAIAVTWATAHGIRDLAASPNAFDAAAAGATWTYATVDNVPPALASLTPAASATVRSLQKITLLFDEPVTGLSAGSLTINGVAAQSLAGSGAGPYTFEFTQPATGTVAVALSAVARDLAVPPNTFGGSNWTYLLDTNLPPPTFTRGPYLQNPTTRSIVIRWRTATAADSSVWYGPSPEACTNQVADATTTTEHSLTVDNLQPATKYYYAVGTTDGARLTSTNFFFVTDPPIGPSRPTRIFVLTDFGTRDSYEQNLRDAYQNFAATNGAANVWISCGDNDQTDGSDNNYSVSVFGAAYGYSNLLQNLALRPTPGNHDYGNSRNTGATYYANFTMPASGEAGGVPSGSENYYSYDYANIHFISLDAITQSHSASTNSEMIQWLYRDLASNTQRWTIAYWHGPPYSRGTHDSDSTTDTLSWMTQMRENVVPVLEAFGVDLVLNGHCHLHERTWLLNGHYGYSSTFSEAHKVDAGDGRIDGDGAYLKPPGQKAGTVYMVVPSGGQPRTSSSTQHPATLMRLQNVLGSCIIDVNGDRLDVQAFGAYSPYTDFQIVDHFTILKSPQPVAPAAPAELAATQNGSQINLAWRNTPTNEIGFKLERSTDGVHFTEIATVGANRTNYTDTTAPLTATAWLYRVRAYNDRGSSAYSPIAAAGAALAPVIAEHPQSVQTAVGSPVVFTVSAGGTAPLRYQWYLNGAPLPNATNSALVLASAQPGDAGTYKVVVSNLLGAVTSAEATLTLGTVVYLNARATGGRILLAWPADSEGFELQTSDLLGPAANWQPVTIGILTNGGVKSFDYTPPADRRSGYFRLRKN